MSKLEELQPNAAVRAKLPDSLVAVVNVAWFGSDALELTYNAASGKVDNQLLYRDDEASSKVAPGHSMVMVKTSDWCPRPTELDWLTSSTPFWRCTHQWWILCLTRSQPSTNPCCRANLNNIWRGRCQGLLQRAISVLTQSVPATVSVE